MVLSTVQRALIISLILHFALFFIFVRSRLDDSASNVMVHVQYQEGANAGDEPAPTHTEQSTRVPVEVSGGAKSSQMNNSSASTEAGVSGESLGLKARYPKLSRVLGESGQVQIEVRKANREVVIRRSSGFKRLDESAVKTIQGALQSGDFDKTFGARETILINFVFRLNESATTGTEKK